MVNNPAQQAKGGLVLVTLLLSTFSLWSQERDTINTEISTDAEYLIRDVFLGGGDCFEVFNIQLSGEVGQAGTFENGNTAVGFQNGIVLSNGNVTPIGDVNDDFELNNNPLSTGYNNISTDPDIILMQQLEFAPENQVFLRDQVILEFDFTPTLDSISFDFVFASEEYCQYILSNWTDIFGFFISGPGISGPYSNGGINIATVTGTDDIITAGGINSFFNPQYYQNNIPPGEQSCSLGQPAPVADIFAFNGLTVPFTASAAVIPCETYHLKMVVTDRGQDASVDAAVFLKANSFAVGRTARLSGGVGSNTPNPIEDCASTTDIIFSRGDNVTTEDLIIRYSILGNSTATPGLDFSGLPDSLIIPAGELADTIQIDILSDNLVEGTEFFTIKLQNPCDCSEGQLTVFIEEPDPLEGIIAGPDQICFGEGVPLLVTPSGGFGDIDYLWSNGDIDSLFNDVPIADASYSVILSDECNQLDTIYQDVVVTNPAAVIDGSGVICDGLPDVDFPIALSGGVNYSFDIIAGSEITNYSGITGDTLWINTTETAIFQLNNLMADGCPGTTNGFAAVFAVDINTTAELDSLNCFGDQDGVIDLTPANGDGVYSYQWSHDVSLNAPTATALNQDSYTVFINDSQGCLDTITVELPEPPLVELQIDTLELVANCLQNGSLNASAMGGTLPYTYAWSNGTTTPDNDDLRTGLYDLTITDSKGCDFTQATEIISDSIVPVVSLLALDSLDCIVDMVTFDASASSQGGNYTYEWTNSTTNTVLSPADPNFLTVNDQNNYNLEITNNDNGCNTSGSISAIDNTNSISFDISSEGEISCDNSNVLLFVADSTANWQAEWRDASGTVLAVDSWTFTASSSAVYQVVVTDLETGCNNTSSLEVMGSTETPNLILTSVTDTLNCLVSQVDVLVNTTNGSGNFDYQWDGPTGGILTNTQVEDIEVGLAGIYTLIVTDQVSGCSDTLSMQVQENIVEPVLEELTDAELTCSTNSLDITASSNSAGNLSYEWFDAAGNTITQADIVQLTAVGTYSVTLTNANNGCTDSETITITNDLSAPEIQLAMLSDTLSCIVDEVNINADVLNGSGNYSYQWSGPVGGILSNEQAEDIMAGLAGNYQLIVNDLDNGCADTLLTAIAEDLTPPVLDLLNDSTLNCAVTSISVNASSPTSGSLSYEWFDASGASIGIDNTIELSNTGTYSVTLTDTNSGCTATESILISSNTTAPVVALVNMPATLDCFVNESTLDAEVSSGSGDYSYQWNGPTGGISGNGQQEDILAFEPGDYTLILTDNSNDCTDTLEATVTEEIGTLSLEPIPDTMLTCVVSSIELTAVSPNSGNLQYEWFDAAGMSLQVGSSITLLDTGSYTYSVIDLNNSCTQTSIVQIGMDTLSPNIQAEAFTDLDCENPMTTLAATPGPSGQIANWFDSNGAPLNTSSWTQDVNAAGNYLLEVNNPSNGCSSEQLYTVMIDTIAPLASITEPDVLDCDQSMVTLTSQVSSGSGNYTYLWSGPAMGIDGPTNATTAIATLEGEYFLTITDQTNGCTADLSSTLIADEDQPQLEALPIDTILNCYDPMIQLIASSNSSGPLTYSWQDASGTEIIASSTLPVGEIGTYTIVLTNTDNNCSDQLTIVVTEDFQAPSAQAGDPVEINCTQGDATLNAEVGPSNWTPSWLDENDVLLSSGDWNLTTTEAGDYQLVVLDTNNGCEASDMVTVTLDQSFPLADAGADLTIDCFSGIANLETGNSSVGDNIIYTLQDANGVLVGQSMEPDFGITAAGTYELIVTDTDNNCSSSDEVVISSEAPVILALESENIPCNGSSGSITIAEVQGGTQPYLYSLDGGNTFQAENATSNLPAGTYQVIVQDANGCEVQGSASITQATGVNIILPEQFELQVGESIELNPVFDRDTSLLASFNWTVSDQLACDKCIDNEFTARETELVTFSVIDEAGCSASVNVLFIVDQRIPIYVPNVFSPNNDGNNDTFTIFADGDQVQDIARFEIYDRWGSLVYSGKDLPINNPEAGWDGTKGGRALNSGVFVYQIEVRLSNGETTILQGDILLAN